MTGVDAIRLLEVGSGEAVVPVWSEADASPDWQETEWRGFGDDEREPFGGAWEGAGGSLRIDYPYDEVCVMLAGRVALIDADGRRREFGAGEAFFVPRGFSGVWETLEPSQKIFVALPWPCPRQCRA